MIKLLLSQDWAEPKDEGTGVANGGPTNYGTATDTRRTPSIATNQPSIYQDPQPQQESDPYPQPYQTAENNPFTAVWNDSYK